MAQRILDVAGLHVALYFTRPHGEPQPLLPPAIGRLAEIGVPSLIIAADGDVTDILVQADLLHEGIAGARKAVLPGVAHVPNMERPDEFNRLVLGFLDRELPAVQAG